MESHPCSLTLMRRKDDMSNKKSVKTSVNAATNHDSCKAIIDGIKSIATRHTVWSVFEDWVKMSAIAVSNAIDKNQWNQREAEYLETVRKYTPEELNIFAQMLVELVTALDKENKEDGPKDLLGQIFHSLELHNKYKGQYFTPPDMCNLMGGIMLNSKQHEDELSQKGYITLMDECVGAGGLVLGFAKAMKDNKLNYQKQLVVYCRDIDIKCVYMAYLQLSLQGIPAVVIHGDTLKNEEQSRWYTPVYIVDGWRFRERLAALIRLTTSPAEVKTAESEEREEIK